MTALSPARRDLPPPDLSGAGPDPGPDLPPDLPEEPKQPDAPPPPAPPPFRDPPPQPERDPDPPPDRMAGRSEDGCYNPCAADRRPGDHQADGQTRWHQAR
ncbi:hypothetical protein XINFAN_03728 [Pseudogemmobacter humi]|uniref:Uncharacterized protein n=2 Tax=Pseudogemmobacter humi TaxID=2483812 RepID=A0A3P5XEU2_9RHOB|nr:hypothetical protein XINFAN_03728 [Pseudogemmobacter humi]